MFVIIENTYGNEILLNIETIITVRVCQNGDYGIKTFDNEIVYVDKENYQKIIRTIKGSMCL